MSDAFIVGVAAQHKVTKLTVVKPAPYRHHHVMHCLSYTGIGVERHQEFVQGFVDSEGKFLTRLEALERVRASGQPLISVTQSDVLGLFSEDLW